MRDTELLRLLPSHFISNTVVHLVELARLPRQEYRRSTSRWPPCGSSASGRSKRFTRSTFKDCEMNSAQSVRLNSNFSAPVALQAFRINNHSVQAEKCGRWVDHFSIRGFHYETTQLTPKLITLCWSCSRSLIELEGPGRETRTGLSRLTLGSPMT